MKMDTERPPGQYSLLHTSIKRPCLFHCGTHEYSKAQVLDDLKWLNRFYCNNQANIMCYEIKNMRSVLDVIIRNKKMEN